MANGRIQWQVGFDIQQANLNQLKTSLQQIRKLTISDVMKINQTDAKKANQILSSIRKEALEVEDALKNAFNPKLNTVNIETFKKNLDKAGTSVEQIYSNFKKAGTAGQNAFRSLSSQVLSTNVQLKQSHTLLDKMAYTLGNTIRWNIAATAVNSLSRSVEQAWGYVKSLDTSLNNIRIVTGKSSDQMANFAVQANEAAKSLGRTTTDYTNAALIFAQQGIGTKIVEARLIY